MGIGDLMKPGKLYRCDKCQLLVYPTKKAAQLAKADKANDRGIRAAGVSKIPRWLQGPSGLWATRFWSKKLKCKVQHGDFGEVFICLEQKGRFIHVLFGEKQGWILAEDINFERLL